MFLYSEKLLVTRDQVIARINTYKETAEKYYHEGGKVKSNSEKSGLVRKTRVLRDEIRLEYENNSKQIITQTHGSSLIDTQASTIFHTYCGYIRDVTTSITGKTSKDNYMGFLYDTFDYAYYWMDQL